MKRVNLWYRSLMSMCAVGLVVTAGWTQSLTWLGTLDDVYDSYAYDVAVSTNGPVVVGQSRDFDGFERGFIWTRSTGMQRIPTFGGYRSVAYAVSSSDARFVVGWAEDDREERRAFRLHRPTGTMENLGTLGGRGSEALGISQDGVVVVGQAQNRAGQRRAFRWFAGEMRDLGTLGGSESVATSISVKGLGEDREIVVGWAQDRSGAEYSFRWGPRIGMNFLDASNDTGSFAYAISEDARTVVGRLSEFGAYRWTLQSGRMLALLGFGGRVDTTSVAYDVSADGSVIVGQAGRNRAARWTPPFSSGEDLNTTYADLLRDGSRLEAARGISADGRYIVGWGFNARTRRTEAFLLDTYACVPRNGDTDGDCMVNDIDLLAVLLAFGQQGNADADMNCDGTVNDVDLLTVLLNFGTGQPCL